MEPNVANHEEENVALDVTETKDDSNKSTKKALKTPKKINISTEEIELAERCTDVPAEYPFATIVNWRCVGGFKIGSETPHVMKTGMIFRSATPATGTQEDITFIIEKLSINTLLDLRADSEMIANEKQCPLKTTQSASNIIIRRPIYGYQFMIKGVQLAFWCGADIAKVLGGASLGAKMNALKAFLGGDADKAKRSIVSHMNKDGLYGLYVLFLEHCKAQLLKALTIFVLPSSYPIHLFCNAGKDRTGLIVALVLVAIGVDHKEICKEYSKTQQADFSLHKAFESTLQKSGLKPEFMDAPYEVMDKTLTYLTSAYGSPKLYLDRIGFGEDMRQVLSQILLEEEPNTE